MFVRRGPAIVLSLVLSAAALVIAPSAMAGDGGTAKDMDDCSSNTSSAYKLKVSIDDDSRLQVIGVVFSDDEDVWNWKLRHNDDVSARGEVRARDADRSFRVVRTMVNLVGPDTIAFRAENSRTGEVCRGDLSY